MCQLDPPMVRPGRFSSLVELWGVLYSIATWKNVLLAYRFHVWIRLR